MTPSEPSTANPSDSADNAHGVSGGADNLLASHAVAVDNRQEWGANVDIPTEVLRLEVSQVV